MGKNSGPVLSRFEDQRKWILWTTRTHPSYFPTLLHDYLCHVSFSRYSPLSLEVVEKPNKCNILAPNFLREGRPQHTGRLLARFTIHRFVKFGWIEFSDLRLRSLHANEVECRIYGGWVKTHVQFESVCGAKFMLFWDYVGDPCGLQHIYPLTYIMLHSQDIVTVKLRNHQKKVFGPPICTPCLQKTVQNCFCQNFVKFPPILIIFGRKMAKRRKLCDVYLFPTSPNSRHHTTVLNANVPDCYTTLQLLVLDCSHLHQLDKWHHVI